jgi:LysR family transcriptional activator of glutamate synthase operon
MELRQLRYLVALADEGSFTRAAQQSNVAQPALSRQIQKLEQELGVPLVDRTSRRVALTAAGREVVETARRTLGDLDDLRASLRQTVALLRGRVVFGLTQTPGPVDVGATLAAFHRANPGVELVVREALSVGLAELLRADRFDLALISGIPQADRRGLELVRLASDELRVLLPPGHSLADRTEVRVAELSGERFLSFPPGATIRSAVAAAAKDAGYTPDVAFEISDVARTAALVAQGLGVAVVPGSDAERLAAAGQTATVSIALRRPRLRHEVLLAWRRGRTLSPAAAALRDVVRKQAAS